MSLVPFWASLLANFFDFLAFQKIIENLMRKNAEKSAKINGFELSRPSQNPPKIQSKSMIQKTHDFSSIFAWCFSFFLSSISWKLAFRLDGSTIFKVFAKIVFLLFPCIFGQKNLPKTLPKQGLNAFKNDAKNGLFFNFDFLSYWPRFGSLFRLQVGAKLAQNCFHTWRPSPFLSLLS